MGMIYTYERCMIVQKFNIILLSGKSTQKIKNIMAKALQCIYFLGPFLKEFKKKKEIKYM